MAKSLAFCLTAMLAAKDDAETPNVTRVILKFRKGFPESSLQTNRCKSLSASHNCTARYIRLTSAINAILYSLKRSRTSNRVECTVGPTNSKSFKDTSVELLAEASKTTRTLVVELDCLYTMCIGK